MDRLTERKTSCWIRTKSGKDYTNYTQDWDSINKLASYEDMEELLEKVYGECDGLLETAIEHLVEHPEIEIGNPGKARLLTDDDVDKWERWKKVEEQGWLLELPCMIDDTVYVWLGHNDFTEPFIPCRVREIRIGSYGIEMSLISNHEMIGHLSWHNVRDFGKTVFLTREEAEAKLKKMEDIEETVQNLISKDVSQTAGTGWKDIMEEALNKGSGD